MAEPGGPEPDRSRRPGLGPPRQRRRHRRGARPAAPVDRGRERERDRDDADRLLPVDLHGRGPRPDHGLPVPDRAADLRRRGAAAPDVGLALVRGFPPRPGLHGPRLLLHRAGHEPPHGPAARRPDIDRIRHPAGDPVLRPVPVLGAAGHRRAALQARCPHPDAGPHAHRLDRRDEHPPAADHAGRRRDPPDRRPRLGADRLAARGRRRRRVRHPGRGRGVRVLLPLPPPLDGRPDRGRAGCPPSERA